MIEWSGNINNISKQKYHQECISLFNNLLIDNVRCDIDNQHPNSIIDIVINISYILADIKYNYLYDDNLQQIANQTINNYLNTIDIDEIIKNTIDLYIKEEIWN